MGKKLPKFKKFTTENIESITAKKLQENEANNTKERPSKRRASSKELKSGNSPSNTGDSSTSPGTSELLNTREVSSENSSVLESHTSLPQNFSSLEIKEVDDDSDKTKLTEQVRNQVEVTDTTDLEADLNTCEESTNNVKKNSNIIKAQVQSDIALKEIAEDPLNMEPEIKEACVPKLNPDNPAWIRGTCSPPTATHPFNSLNPHAREFTPGGFTGNIVKTQAKPNAWNKNSSNIQTPIIAHANSSVLTQEVQQNTDMRNTTAPFVTSFQGPVQSNPLETVEHIPSYPNFAQEPSVVPGHKNTGGIDGEHKINEKIQPNIHPDPQATTDIVSHSADDKVRPDLKNSTNKWSSERSENRPSHERHVGRQNERSGYQHNQQNRNKDRSYNSHFDAARDDQKEGRRRYQDKNKYNHSGNRNRDGSYQDNENNSAEFQERNDGNEGRLDSSDNYHRNSDRQHESFDRSGNRSYPFRGTGQQQKHDGRSRNDQDSSYRSYNRGSRGNTRPRDNNRGHYDNRYHEKSQTSGNDWESTSAIENRSDEVKIDNTNQSWRDRSDDSKKQHSAWYRNRRGDNISHDHSGNVRDGADKRFSSQSRGRDNFRESGRYNRSNRRSSPETPEIINDHSSKDSTDNYHITDDDSNETPEKSWGKNDVSQETNPPVSGEWDAFRTNDAGDGGWGTVDDAAWDGDWNTSVDLPQPTMERDNVNTEVSQDKQKSQTNVRNIFDEKSSSRQSWEDNPTKEEKGKMSQSRRSYETNERSHRGEKSRGSYDNQKKYMDPRQEREKANRSTDGNHGMRPSERTIKQTPITAYVDTDKDSRKRDQEFYRWEASWRNIDKFRVVNEIQANLFEQPKDYSLAHCVAEDLRMGSGIAVDFKREFKNLPELLDQRAKQGGLATLHDPENNRFVYYLVTKRESTGKPTYQTLWRSLDKMRTHIKENEVKKLAIPRLACGLDRLEWKQVKSMLEFLFTDVPVEITVCNYQQDEEVPKKSITCKLVVEEYPVTKIASGTLIFYFSTEDGLVDDNMQKLSEKFNFLSGFKSRKNKKVGEIIYSEDKNYGLCGCIVRKNLKDPLSFTGLSKCIWEFNKLNKAYGNDAFQYVSFQWVDEKQYHDDFINQKIITLLINQLRYVDVYVCRGSFEDKED